MAKYIASLLLFLVIPVMAQEVDSGAAMTVRVRWNNDNIWTEPQPPPDGMPTLGEDNVWRGQLVDGTAYTQWDIVSTPELQEALHDITFPRLQRFQIDDAFWYVSDLGEIWAGSDLQALSIYLARKA